MSSKTIQNKALILGYSGVIPFAALAILAALDTVGLREMALSSFFSYSAIILSFLGGIRWGAAASVGNNAPKGLVFSVLPSIWAALFLIWPSDQITVWGLMTGFILIGLADWLCPGLKVPAWMVPLRVRLTVAVVICHLILIAVM